jgi:hypothetical protein
MDIDKFNESPQHMRAMMMYVAIHFQEFINTMEENTLCILMKTSSLSDDMNDYTRDVLFQEFMHIFMNVINWKDNIATTNSIYIATMSFVEVWSEEMKGNWRSIYNIIHTIYSPMEHLNTKQHFSHNISILSTHFSNIKQLFLVCMPQCDIL